VVLGARHRLALVATLSGAGCSLVDAAGDDRAADAAPGSGGDSGTSSCAVTDDFEDGVAGHSWVPYDDEGAAVTESAGALRVSFTGSTEAWGGYDLRNRVDFTEGEVRVEIESVGGTYTGINLELDDMELELYVEDGETLFGEVYNTPDADDYTAVPFEPDLHRVWRIRSDGALIYWEVSADGNEWETIHTQAPPFLLDDLLVAAEAGGESGDPPAAFASFATTPAGCAR
jgi:hypothetical protein